METEKKAKSPVVKIVVIVIIIGLLGALGYFGQKLIRENFLKKSEVGIIDKDEITNMTEFKKARNAIKLKVAQKQQEYAQKAQGMSESQQQELFLLFQQEAKAIEASELKPLLDKAQAAVALVAREKKQKVVLDKKIVVCGAVDITEEVKDTFRESETLEAPKEDIGAESQIGYFDQEVVRSLKIFRDADDQFAKWYDKIKKEAEETIRNAPASEKQKLFMEYNRKYKFHQSQLYGPILEKVTKTVEKVAKNVGLILVLDKQYVMYGGRNITDEVVNILK